MAKSGYKTPEMLVDLYGEDNLIYTSSGDTDIDFPEEEDL